MDVHDRALLYYRLLKTNAKEVMVTASQLFISQNSNSTYS